MVLLAAENHIAAGKQNTQGPKFLVFTMICPGLKPYANPKSNHKDFFRSPFYWQVRVSARCRVTRFVALPPR
jgi:hypothetical protein